jgi:hypothetical protein
VKVQALSKPASAVMNLRSVELVPHP